MRKAAELNPEDSGLITVLAKLEATASEFVSNGDIDKAIRVCLVIATILPTDTKIRFNLASLMRDKGDIEGAILQYEYVTRVAPEKYLAHYNLAKLAKRLGRTREAITYYRRTLTLKPNLHQALNNLAWILATESSREVREAIRLAERACQLTDRSEASLLDTLSVAYEADGQITLALSTAEEALGLAASKGEHELVVGLRQRIRLLKLANPK